MSPVSVQAPPMTIEEEKDRMGSFLGRYGLSQIVETWESHPEPFAHFRAMGKYLTYRFIKGRLDGEKKMAQATRGESGTKVFAD